MDPGGMGEKMLIWRLGSRFTELSQTERFSMSNHTGNLPVWFKCSIQNTGTKQKEREEERGRRAKDQQWPAKASNGRTEGEKNREGGRETAGGGCGEASDDHRRVAEALERSEYPPSFC